MFEDIQKTEVSDLVDKKEWTLTFKDFGSVTAENLYLSLSPKKFLTYFQNKEKLSTELIDVCTAVEVQSAISVTWKLDKETYPEERTLFIPQSMTHEWGHFLVEFESYNYQNKEQLCHVLFLIHEEEPQSEDLASKIKLMKRVLDRVFPDIEKHIKQEFIRFDEEMFISHMKDSAMEQISFDYPTLKFLGQAAPMASHFQNEKYLSRVLLS
jgi:protoporphyrinogen oxidase